MTCRAIELLTEIRDRLRNLDTLEEKRRKKSARQARYRAKQKHVDATQHVDATKEDEKGKETSPPAPPIEKSEKLKKGAGEGEDARARRIQKVSAYNDKIGGNIDAEYFVDYYADRWPRGWRARLRNWLKEPKRSGRIKPARTDGAARTPPPRETDWTLCAERCANCRGEGCTCGIAVPPACETHPRPPEECTSYQPLTANN